MQPAGGAAHVTFLEHGFEQHEKVEVDSREIDFVQHVAEIISLASAAPAIHSVRLHSVEELMDMKHVLIAAALACAAAETSSAQTPRETPMAAPDDARLAAAAPAEAREVVAFWENAGPGLWFAKDAEFDRRFRERFLPLHEAAARGELNGWIATPAGALALMVLLDQFPRNSFRGTPRMYATDAAARTLAAAAIAAGHDRAMAMELQKFFYLPFAHSENLADQERAVELCRRLGGKDLRQAEHHRDIVRRFGRFPHRNTILGRPSTQAEQEYLANGGYTG
jgi:uncharacterized protein (DUF924 family)